MRLQNTTLGAATLGVIALALAGCSTSSEPGVNLASETVVLSADYPVFDSIESASDEADLIVKGEYIDSAVELLYPTIETEGDPESNPQQGIASEEVDLEEMAIVTTVSQLRITEVLKGDVNVGDIIEVSQVGGEYDDVTYDEESTTLLSEVDVPEVALFLNQTSDTTFDLINPAQGIFTVEGNTVEASSNEESFSDIATIDELREVIEDK